MDVARFEGGRTIATAAARRKPGDRGGSMPEKSSFSSACRGLAVYAASVA
jgi:hypothetical protein